MSLNAALPARVRTVLVNRWLGWVALAPLVVLIFLSAFQLNWVRSHPDSTSLLVYSKALSTERTLNDYDEFYLVGRLYREGDIRRAYDVNKLLVDQKRFIGAESFLPWAYPPQFTALMTVLPIFGIFASFILFVGGSLAFFVFVLARFGREYAGASIVAVYPAMLLNGRLGQNGFLTAGFIGLFLLLYSKKRQGAGVPLGLLGMKPHLGLALGLLTLISGYWRTILIAFIVLVATLVLATLMLGVDIWPAFLAGARQSSAFLQTAGYSLYRMSSVYGSLRSFGMSASASFVIHAIVALLLIGLMVFAYVRSWDNKHLLSVVVLANMFISPYNHDYDYVCLAFAISLLLPELLDRIRLGELALFYVFVWIGTGSGLLQHLRAVLFEHSLDHPRGSSLDLSFQAIGILAAAILVAIVIRRTPLSASDEPATLDTTRSGTEALEIPQ